MEVYVIDTHALIWYLAGSYTLGLQAKKVMDNICNGQAIGLIPVIDLLEIHYLYAKGRIPISVQQVLDKIYEIIEFQIVQIEPKYLLEMDKCLMVPDVHDRFIVAVAKVEKAKLVSKDEKITQGQLVEMIW